MPIFCQKVIVKNIEKNSRVSPKVGAKQGARLAYQRVLVGKRIYAAVQHNALPNVLGKMLKTVALHKIGNKTANLPLRIISRKEYVCQVVQARKQ